MLCDRLDIAPIFTHADLDLITVFVQGDKVVGRSMTMRCS